MSGNAFLSSNNSRELWTFPLWDEKKSISTSKYHTPVVLTVNILMVWAGAHRKSATKLVKYCLRGFFAQALFMLWSSHHKVCELTWMWTLHCTTNPNSHMDARVNTFALIGFRKRTQNCYKFIRRKMLFEFHLSIPESKVWTWCFTVLR